MFVCLILCLVKAMVGWLCVRSCVCVFDSLFGGCNGWLIICDCCFFVCLRVCVLVCVCLFVCSIRCLLVCVCLLVCECLVV